MIYVDVGLNKYTLHVHKVNDREMSHPCFYVTEDYTIFPSTHPVCMRVNNTKTF